MRGYQPGVNSKAVLAAAAAALSRRPARGAGHDDLLAAVQAEPAGRRLYVIVHSIDGPGARRGALWGGGGDPASAG